MSAQPQPGDPTGTLAAQLMRAVVEPTFAAVEPPTDATLPAVLLRSRRERAKGRIAEALAWRGRAVVDAALRREVEQLVVRWAAEHFDDGFREADAFAIRCASAHTQPAWGGDDELAAEEKRYRREVERLHGSIEIRGLQTSARVLQSMDLVFVPLHVEDLSVASEVVRVGEGIEVRRTPRERVPDVLERHAQVVIVGAPGSGKTTLVSHLALQAASGTHGDLLPFIVPVRSLEGCALDEATIAALAGCAPGLVQTAFAAKRALVLLDGLDESAGGAAALTPSLQRLAARHPGNRIVATSRPAGVGGDGNITIPGFTTVLLQALTRDEVYDFIDRWCRAAERSLQRDPRRADDDAQKAADDLKDRVRRSRPVERLAETPLMCSVLCIVHRFLGQRIPERRAALYEACTNVLLYEWDRAKFPSGALVGKLDAQQKRAVLAGVAVVMHREHRAELPEPRVVVLMGERLARVGRDAHEAKGILGEIRDRSGLLVERRPGVFGFSHLTFQEYLTALELAASDEGVQEMVSHQTDPWWHEVIALAAGMAGPRSTMLLRGLLDADKDAVGSATMLAAQCLETAVDLPVSLRREVESRVATLVPPRSDEDTSRLFGLGAVAGPALLRAFDTATVEQQARMAMAFAVIRYEPALPTLVRMLEDERKTEVSITYIGPGGAAFSFLDRGGVKYSRGFRLREFASTALVTFAARSALARTAFSDALRNHPDARDELRRTALGLREIFPRILGSALAEMFREADAIIRVHPPSPRATRGARSD